LLFGEIFQLFNLKICNNHYLVIRSVFLTALTVTGFYVCTPFLSPILPYNRLQIVYLFLILLIPIIIWRFIYIQAIFSPKYFKTVIFIGKTQHIKKMLVAIKKDNFHQLTAYFSDDSIPSVSGYNDIHKHKISKFLSTTEVNEIVVSKKGLSDEVLKSLNEELIFLFQKGFNIISYENFYESLNFRIPKVYLEDDFYLHINFSKNNSNRFYLFGVRFLDIGIAMVGILLFSLLVPPLLLGNLFANRGSFFYSQVRVGRNGKPFNIFKLRSMFTNSEKDGAVWAKKNDQRITVFGKFLRKTRLDEIPQFWNILKGDMSIIGPRPERPEFAKDLSEKIPFYAIRNVIRPGLTGWAQVNYPYANTIEEQETKLRYDLYYIKERNALLDFKILIKTLTTVLFFKGQ
jgi:exopolysaccharide biosynthesis polyprenyl glycosylphosphotransferase